VPGLAYELNDCAPSVTGIDSTPHDLLFAPEQHHQPATASDDGALRILPSERAFPTVRLVDPVLSGFVLLAAEIDRRPGPLFPWPSPKKRRLIADAKRLCDRLRQTTGVRDTTVFRALLAPPGGRGPYLRRRGESVHRARFDLVVLVENESLKAAEDLLAHPLYRELDARVGGAARYVYATTATNVKRIGPVDHSRDGVFLFNYFVADRLSQNIVVRHYTAGWLNRGSHTTERLTQSS
jgi:hypothetical protein